jgi:taurine dioxygenase
MLIHSHGPFDNAAEDYQHIEAHPLAAAMGAEIRGVDIRAVTDEQFAEIERALFRHKMIFFREQTLSHSEHESFAARFGAFAEDAYTEGVPGYLNIQPLIKEADARVDWIFGSGWHTDSPFLETPPAISMLYAVEVPPFGGDTIWANTALAYSMLSDKMKSVLKELQVHMSMRNVFTSVQKHGDPTKNDPVGALAAIDPADIPQRVRKSIEGAFHPLVRTHPRTGEQALYCDSSYAIGIEGMTEQEAAPILGFLAEFITQPVMTCRLRWQPGTFTLWDNRLCLHQAFNDYDGYRREFYRCTIAG